MAPHITKSIILLTILYVIIYPLILLIQGQQQVPCLFIFGDSLSDNGNNNFIFTFAKFNYLPYGINYRDGPTGRTSNGKIIPDFLAELLGFNKPIPPSATARGRDILNGVNYASSAAGILEQSGAHAVGRISMNKQLLHHEFTVFNINLLLGNSTQSTQHLNKCMYIVNMGSNDYANNYYLPEFYQTSFQYTPEDYADHLIQQYSQQLGTLYKHGARKIAVFGLGRIGCSPQMLTLYPHKGSECVDFVNNAIELFNSRLKSLIDDFNNLLENAQFILINTYNIIQEDHQLRGIKYKNTPCCVVSPITGLCEKGKAPCKNINEHAFWDNYHHTEGLNRVTAERAYSAKSQADVYPFDIRRLAQL